MADCNIAQPTAGPTQRALLLISGLTKAVRGLVTEGATQRGLLTKGSVRRELARMHSKGFANKRSEAGRWLFCVYRRLVCIPNQFRH